jgi:AAA domain
MANGARPSAGPGGLQGRVLLGNLLKSGIEPTPQLLEGLLYTGKIHSIAGPAGIGKTILAVWMCLQVMLKGLPVLYLDAENGPKIIAERLSDMGADLCMLDRLFHYYPADLMLDPDSLAALQATVMTAQPALIVFDSLADFLGMADVDENSNTDCTRWFAKVIQPLKNENVASLVLDHVSKTGKGGPRGASSKVAKMDVQWELTVKRTFSREQGGKIELRRTKDRESWLPKTVQFSIGGGVFPRLAKAIEEPDDPHVRLTDNAMKLYDTIRKAGKEGARWTDLEHAVGSSKGNVTRGLEELDGCDLMEKRNGRYVVNGAVPEQPNPIPDSRSTARYHNGTLVGNGTSGSGSVPPGTTPQKGWY